MGSPSSDHYSGVSDTPTTIFCDRRVDLQEDAAISTYSYSRRNGTHTVPRALFFASRDFGDATPSVPDTSPPPNIYGRFHSLPPNFAFAGGPPSVDQVQGVDSQYQAPFDMDRADYSILLGLMFPAGGPSPVDQVQGVDSQYQAPFDMDPEDYSILLGLMFPAVVPSHPQQPESNPPEPPHHQPATNQQSSPCMNLRQSPPAGCEFPRDSTPARQSDVLRGASVVDRPSVASIWKYIKPSEGRGYVCLWELPSGGVCKFEANLEQLKKHLKRVHYELKSVVPYNAFPRF